MDKKGDIIKRIRKQLGLSQTAFGKIMGVTQASISDFEKGKINPSKTFWKFFQYRYLDNVSERAIVTSEDSTNARLNNAEFRLSRIENKLDKILETFIIPDGSQWSKKSSGEW